ncbi:MAG: pseudouridine synthase, partial [Phototrophicales bacterium]|nr:pseudouridine synthase [Phototrophicales bacterium]
MDRVQKILSQAGLGSRRACEAYIEQGRVRVNGTIITLGAQADPIRDVIEVDGERLNFKTLKKRYFAFYKPANVLSSNTANHEDERPIVRDMLPVEGHLFTIGRLDAESEGLMVLTNDGETTNQLAHPRYEHTKTYLVTVYGKPDKDILNRWQDGVWLEEGRSAPSYVTIMDENSETTALQVVMTEGKKRQIRRVATILGYPVKKLVRTHIGQLDLGKLKRGEWSELNALEVEAMKTPAPEIVFIKKRRKILRETSGGPRRASGDKSAVRPRGMNARPKSDSYVSRERRDGDGRPPRGFSRDEASNSPRPLRRSSGEG